MKTKKCFKCKINKLVCKFSKGTNKDKLFSYCKDCSKQYQKLYKLKSYKKKVLKDFTIRDLKEKQYQKEYFFLKNINNKKAKLLNKIRKALFRIVYINYKIKRIKENKLKRKMNTLLRNRINKALKRNSKYRHLEEIIGCSVKFLKQYLQKRFKKGMDWQNWGKGVKGKGYKEWHIDHIRPCASFDLSKKSEQCKCFHYTNLQPLWAKDNMVRPKIRKKL